MPRAVGVRELPDSVKRLLTIGSAVDTMTRRARQLWLCRFPRFQPRHQRSAMIPMMLRKGQPSNMALQRTRAARFARIGSPLNARPFGGF
jgi:hypothetical protein